MILVLNNTDLVIVLILELPIVNTKLFQPKLVKTTGL